MRALLIANATDADIAALRTCIDEHDRQAELDQPLPHERGLDTFRVERGEQGDEHRGRHIVRTEARGGNGRRG